MSENKYNPNDIYSHSNNQPYPNQYHDHYYSENTHNSAYPYPPYRQPNPYAPPMQQAQPVQQNVVPQNQIPTPQAQPVPQNQIPTPQTQPIPTAPTAEAAEASVKPAYPVPTDTAVPEQAAEQATVEKPIAIDEVDSKTQTQIIPTVNGGGHPKYHASSYDYQTYQSQFRGQTAPATASSSRQTPPKKDHKGRQIALIAGTLALALCLGVGGGIVGATLTGGRQNNSVAASTEQSNAASQQETSTVTRKEENSIDRSTEVSITESSSNTKAVTTVQEVVNKVKDSVVEIKTESTSYSRFYGQYIMQSAGSGVIISSDGYIITNHHVIEDATTVEITLTNGNTYNAEIVGSDSVYDLALLKIDADNLTAATLGDSSKLSLAETSIVIGNSLGELGGTVTTGVISSLNRVVTIDGQQMELLQTDAAINPGNSGGGLFDMNGDLVGVVVAKSVTTSSGTTVEGIGYAIPVNNVKSILSDLKTKGKVTGRAALGIKVLDVQTDSAKSRYGVDKTGVYIYEINRGSAAEKAGLKVGDCILQVGDAKVESTTDVSAALLKLKAGDTVDIKIYRDGSEKTVSVTLDEAEEQSESSNSNNFHYDENSGNDIPDWYYYFMQ